jgi:hypothetical protein
MARSTHFFTVVLLLGLAAVIHPRSIAACTVVAARDKNGELFTINQEDWGGVWAGRKATEAAVLFLPAGKGQLARLLFSWKGLSIEGGMNEKGLVYDFVALGRPSNLLPDQGKLRYPGPLGEKILAECATVAEAKKLYETYEEKILGYGAEIISDAEGSAIIVYWDRAAGRVAMADREDGLQFSDKSGSVTRTRPDLFGLGARYAAVLGAGTDGLDMAQATRLAALTLGDETAYTCIYDQARRKLRVFYSHDLSRFVDFEVDGEAIRTKRFAWLWALMPGQAPAFHPPLPVLFAFSPLEILLFFAVLLAGLSFGLQAAARPRLGWAVWAAYGFFLGSLVLGLAALVFFGRVIAIYGLSLILQAAVYLPWALAASSLALAAASLFGPRPRPRLALPHGLVVAAIGLGLAAFLLCRGSLY